MENSTHDAESEAAKRETENGRNGQKNHPKVVTQPDGLKQVAVKNIVDWYAHWQGVQIADRDVHFFDDRADNVEPFARTNYSARQVSCHTRDPDLGQGPRMAVLSVSAVYRVLFCRFRV